MRRFFAVAMGSVVALVGFAGAANASATIDLIWANGSNTIEDVATSSLITLSVILTAGPAGSAGAGVSVDYSAVVGKLGVVAFASTAGGPLPIALGGEPNDTGSQIQNISSVAFPPFVGVGIVEGQSHQLGTVTFHKDVLIAGTFELRSGVFGPTDDVLRLDGVVINDTTTFNSAMLINVPEPGALSMLMLGLAGLTLAGRGRRS